MIFHKATFAFAMGLLFVLLGIAPVPSSADETRTVEWYLERARPHLHHSCQSAWDAVERDTDRFVELVGIVSAVSFYNHDFDIGRLTALSEAKQDELQREFYEEIGELCRQNNQSLFAGVVDHALTGAIAKIAAAEK